MKRAAAEHPKLQRLQRRLKLTRWQAMGLLEALWHFTGRYAAEGDLGRWSDEEIAAWIEWEGDAGELIEALSLCKWLDRHPDPKVRLLVHDWPEHADEATKIALKRSGKTFSPAYCRDSVATGFPDQPEPGDSVATVSRPPEPEPCQSLSPAKAEPDSHTADPDGDGPAAERVSDPPGGADREEPSKRGAWVPHWSAFLSIYPPRNGDLLLAKGEEIFQRVVTKGGVPVEQLLEGVRRYRAWCDHDGTTGTRFVKQIPTWLNGRCWGEVYAIVANGARAGPPAALVDDLVARSAAVADEVKRRMGVG